MSMMINMYWILYRFHYYYIDFHYYFIDFHYYYYNDFHYLSLTIISFGSIYHLIPSWHWAAKLEEMLFCKYLEIQYFGSMNINFEQVKCFSTIIEKQLSIKKYTYMRDGYQLVQRIWQSLRDLIYEFSSHENNNDTWS